MPVRILYPIALTYIVRKLGLKRRVCRKTKDQYGKKDELLLTIHDSSHFLKGNAAMCHGANKIQKDWKLWNWGLGKLDCETGTGKLLGLLLSSISFGPSVCLPRPPRPIEDITDLLLRRPFYTLRRQRSANQRSPLCTWHLADQSAIASRRTPLLFYWLFRRSPKLIK